MYIFVQTIVFYFMESILANGKKHPLIWKSVPFITNIKKVSLATKGIFDFKVLYALVLVGDENAFMPQSFDNNIDLFICSGSLIINAVLNLLLSSPIPPVTINFFIFKLIDMIIA